MLFEAIFFLQFFFTIASLRYLNWCTLRNKGAINQEGSDQFRNLIRGEYLENQRGMNTL